MLNVHRNLLKALALRFLIFNFKLTITIFQCSLFICYQQLFFHLKINLTYRQDKFKKYSLPGID